MSTLIHERVAAAHVGTNPTVICRMPSGWAVLCDVQFLRGYTILLSDPVVPDLNALDREHRAQFLLDMVTIGDALLEVTGAFRINYEILGNLDPALHAHSFRATSLSRKTCAKARRSSTTKNSATQSNLITSEIKS